MKSRSISKRRRQFNLKDIVSIEKVDDSNCVHYIYIYIYIYVCAHSWNM